MSEKIEKISIRNVAVIAHVDHGKTTLIDALLKQTHVFRDNQHEMGETQILDSNDLERERGITILAKNCAVKYKGTKINIIDTPGHADFSGEVERTLGMADGALLIIDAQEGPMPQTRFVLKKAIEQNLKIIVLINKIDKPFARIDKVLERTETLFLELANEDHHLDFPVMYSVSRDGVVYAQRPSAYNPVETDSVFPLLDKIIEYIPEPANVTDGPFKMVVSSLDYDSHIGRILIGKIHQGVVSSGKSVVIAQSPSKRYPVEQVMVSEGLGRIPADVAVAGDIVAISGISEAIIGNTITDPSDPEALPVIAVSDPTLHMYLGQNTSPFSGKEGEFSTSRQLETRLMRELETNLSLRVEKNEGGGFRISGRGELHLAILIESMRREGYEMEVGEPEVITKSIDGKEQEPHEEVSIVVPHEFVGVISQEMGKRLSELKHMEQISNTETEFIYDSPTRALIGLRNLLITLTKGTIVITSQITGYQPIGKPLPKFRKGALIADSSGVALTYGLHAAQGRGVTFIEPGTDVYEGMIVGRNSDDRDLTINVCKGKKMTNMRSSSSDENIQLAPPTILSLEQSIDFIASDELLEVTPKSLRLRKRYLTDTERRRHRQ